MVMLDGPMAVIVIDLLVAAIVTGEELVIVVPSNPLTVMLVL